MSRSLALTLAAALLAGCASQAASQTPSPQAAVATPTPTATAQPTPAPTPTAELASGMCNIPDLVGSGTWKNGAPIAWQAAGFYGEVTEVGGAYNWVIAKQSPPYPGTAPCMDDVTIYETAEAMPTVEPSPTPMLEPTPTPEPTPAEWFSVPEEELAAACDGTPMPYADAYAGTVHPLAVMVGESGNYWSGDYDINDKWYKNIGWPSPIQLVVCVKQDYVTVGSCGTYKRSDGVVGRVIRERDVQKVRVIVALTGKLLQSKTFYGNTPKCARKVTIPSDDPPWTISGDMVTLATINHYATAVSTQPAP